MMDRLSDIREKLKIYALPLVVAVTGIVVSFLLYWQLQALDNRRINEQFSKVAQKQSKHLQWNLTNYRNALHSAVDLFQTTDRVQLEDFQRIANLIQNRYPEVLALEWLPKVSDEERDDFVANIRRQYDLNYRITEMNSSGDLIEASRRETYYPVTYVQPFASAAYNRTFLGYDHFSRTNRRRAIKKARSQGSITLTPSTVFYRTGFEDRTAQSPNNNLGVIMYKPVFGTQDTRSVEDRHEKPVGVIALLLKIQSVMGPVFEADSFNHNVAVFEHTTNPKNPKSRLIYSNHSPEVVKRISETEDNITFRENFPVSDRSWSVLLWPSERYLHNRRSWAPWLALAFGLLLTTFLVRGSYWLSGELLGRRKEFHSVVDSAEDAIISTDENGAIRLWNTAAKNIFHYERTAIMGDPITRILDESDRDRFRQELDHFRKNETNERAGKMLELKGLKANGTSFPIELTLSRWDQQGQVYFTIIVRDITERKRREERLEELTRNLEEKVNTRTEELEQFVYAASHDLREPARVMETYAGFLEDDLGDELDPDVQKDLRFIRNSAAQMNDLIDSLLTLSRIGQGELELETIDVDICVNQALEQQEELIETSDVTIDRHELPRVQADPALLTDLYQNLLSNAIKHSGNGTVSISLTAEKGDGYWILGVKDNGPGIKPEYQEKIFEPFKHLREADQQDGTGIGLSICRRIVDRHQGDIWVESEPGDGAHFRFTLKTSNES